MIYEISPDEAYKETYYIDGCSKWCMPGVYCDVCNSHWPSTNVAYPAIDLTGIPIDKMLRSSRRKGWNVAFEKYLEYRDIVAQLLPQGALLKPGTDFGPIQGTARGIFPDFSWCMFYLFILRHRYKQLIENGINMPPTAPHELRYKGKRLPPDFLAMQIPYHAKMSPICFSLESPCIKCGYQKVVAPEHIIIEKSSLPKNLDLFYGYELTTFLFVTDRFVDVALKLGITGCKFTPIDVTL